jgi:hypothetical protein
MRAGNGSANVMDSALVINVRASSTTANILPWRVRYRDVEQRRVMAGRQYRLRASLGILESRYLLPPR